MMEGEEKIIERLVEEESEILKKVLGKFGRERISDLNEPEVKGLLTMYERVSRNYTAEKINLEKDKRMRIIREEQRAKAPHIGEELPGKRNESDLPVRCILKSQNGIIRRIQGKKLLSPEGKWKDDIYPCDGKYGVYYRFGCDKLLPLKIKYGEPIKSDFILIQKDWTSKGAQIFPDDPIIISQRDFDNIIDKNDLVYVSGPRDKQMYILKIRHI